MAESSVCSSGMAGTEIVALKETLCTQQQLLQKLYVELEEEREASATAASEALSMILRLQGEKAVEKMEASQYKRMAEEKMHHTEECLAVFEELMYRKEMEIASLEFQVQAYRYKLLSIGFNDLGIVETRFPENPFSQRNVQFGDLGVHGTVRRNKSLPAVRFKDSYSKKGIVEREEPAIPLAEQFPRKIDEDPDCEFDVQREGMQKLSEEFAVGDLNSFWEQIKELDKRVEELSHGKDVDRGVDSDRISSNQGLQSTSGVYSQGLKPGSRYCSMQSAVSRDQLYEPIKGVKGTNLDPQGSFSCSSTQAEYPMNLLEFDESSIPCLETEATRNATYSVSVHDIFEVPHNHENHKTFGSQEQERKKMILEGENRLGKPDSVPEGTSEYYTKDEVEWLKKVLLYAHHANKLSKSRDGATVDFHLALVGPTVGVAPSLAEVHQLNKRLEQLEGERRIVKQEVYDRGEEDLRLLREMHEKLNMIQSEIRSSKVKKCSPPDESSLDSVMEAMLFFSL